MFEEERAKERRIEEERAKERRIEEERAKERREKARREKVRLAQQRRIKLEESAEKGDANAQYELGRYYYDLCNDLLSSAWLTAAAKQGHDGARSQLDTIKKLGHAREFQRKNEIHAKRKKACV